MFAQIAFYKILGLPAMFYGGLFTFLLLLFVATVGMLTVKGKLHWPLSAHVWPARIALLLALLHALLGLGAFLGW